jgi:uncharacterized membrane protein YoaK (UPF0700 family)
MNMHTSGSPDTGASLVTQVDSALVLMRLEERLPPLLSVIAGMVDLTGFFTLGKIFTAHVTGNLVVAAAALVGAGPFRLAQLVAIPVFMLALAGVWAIARTSGRSSVGLVRLLLLVQFVLLAAVMIVSVATRASTDTYGLKAGIAAMIAVAAMASQYALLRLALPGTVSTAVMTGNLTNTVLLSMDLLAVGRLRTTADANRRLTQSVWLLVGFLSGCVAAAVAVSMFGDWAWIFPVVLAAVAMRLCHNRASALGSSSGFR